MSMCIAVANDKWGLIAGENATGHWERGKWVPGPAVEKLHILSPELAYTACGSSAVGEWLHEHLARYSDETFEEVAARISQFHRTAWERWPNEMRLHHAAVILLGKDQEGRVRCACQDPPKDREIVIPPPVSDPGIVQPIIYSWEKAGAAQLLHEMFCGFAEEGFFTAPDMHKLETGVRGIFREMAARHPQIGQECQVFTIPGNGLVGVISGSDGTYVANKYHESAVRKTNATDRAGNTYTQGTWITVSSFSIHLPPRYAQYKGPLQIEFYNDGGLATAWSVWGRLKVGTQYSNEIYFDNSQDPFQTSDLGTATITGLPSGSDITVEVQVKWTADHFDAHGRASFTQKEYVDQSSENL